jgi:integrase/recombinase XerD
MFNFTQLLKDEAAIRRHIQAPFYSERLGYLQQLHAQGAARTTLVARAWLLLAIAHGVRPRPPTPVTLRQIEAAARRWTHRRNGHQPRLIDGKAAHRIYTRTAKIWFGFLGWLDVKRVEHPYAAQLGAFVQYMREERHFSAATIRGRYGAAADFLRWIHGRHTALMRIDATIIDRWLAWKARHGSGRVSIKNYAAHLRSFLCYAEERALSPRGLAASIQLGRVYKTELIPVGPPWDAVTRMLAQQRGSRASQIRDRAILLLFALYGLRSSEVQRLRLEDIDWERALIRVHRSKQNPRVETYPLIEAVRDALADYLRCVRPQTAHREIFLQLFMPYQPLRSSAYWQIVRKRLRPMGLGLKHHGPHSLRHACATRLLERGFNMKVIGDYLGHRYAGSTSTYAKVDTVGLKRVADFDLGRFL